MSAGLAGSKVLLIVAGGAAGSILLNNPYVSGIFKDVAKVIIKHLKEDGEGSSREDDGGAVDASTAALSAQVRRLSQELRQLATLQSRPVVISHGTDRGGVSFLSVAVPAALVGGAAYGYMWWKGIKLSDLMYVTRRGMSQAVESFNKQMGNLTTALSNTKKQLTGRLETVSKNLNESMQVQLAIKKDVSGVFRAVTSVDGEVKTLRGDVQGLEDKINDIKHTSDVAAQGVMFLCNVVTEKLGGISTYRKELEHLSRLTSSATVSRSISFSPSTHDDSGFGGLKDLPASMQALEEAVPALRTRQRTANIRTIGIAGLEEDPPSLTRPLVHSMSSSRVQSPPQAVASAAAAEGDWGQVQPPSALRSSSAVVEENAGHIRSSFDQRLTASVDLRSLGDGGRDAPASQRLPRQQPQRTGEDFRSPEEPRTGAQESSFTQEDLVFPPRRGPGLTTSSSASKRMMPPVNFNL